MDPPPGGSTLLRFSLAKVSFVIAIFLAVALFVVRPSVGFTTFTAVSSDREDGDIQIRRPYYPIPREIKLRNPAIAIGWHVDPHAASSRVKGHKLDNGTEVLLAKFVINQALSDQTLTEVVLAIRFNGKVFEYDAADLLSNTGTIGNFSTLGVFNGKLYIFSLNIFAPTGKSGKIGAIEWPPGNGTLHVVNEANEGAWNGVLSEIGNLNSTTIQSLCDLKLKAAIRFLASVNQEKCG